MCFAVFYYLKTANCKKTATPKNLNFRPLSSKFGRKTIESILQTKKGLKRTRSKNKNCIALELYYDNFEQFCKKIFFNLEMSKEKDLILLFD